MTPLLDHTEIPSADLAALYRRRWAVEIRPRELKTAMEFEISRCKSPEMVHHKWWAGFLAYKLIRPSMLQATSVNDERPEHLRLTATLQVLANTWLPAALVSPPSSNTRDRLAKLRQPHGDSHRVGNRPNHIEPRAIKRRDSPHALLTIRRAQTRARCIARRSSQFVPLHRAVPFMPGRDGTLSWLRQQSGTGSSCRRLGVASWPPRQLQSRHR
jgi:hypothetical protein